MTLLSRPAESTADRIETAYRRTVMSTPHYDDEYGDSHRESVTTGFGPAVASVLGTGGPLTRHQHRAVIGATERSRTEREGFAIG